MFLPERVSPLFPSLVRSLGHSVVFRLPGAAGRSSKRDPRFISPGGLGVAQTTREQTYSSLPHLLKLTRELTVTRA